MPAHRPLPLFLRFPARLLALGVILACFASTQVARAAVWQWSVEVEGAVSPETNRLPRAFLWIPPECERVRGVVVGQHNMLEEGILEHPEFRRELAALGLAEVWVTPALDMVFDFARDDGAIAARFDAMLRALARESGYEELATAAVVPLGHSAAASYPWNFAAWAPERTLAVLSIKGDAPRSHLTGSGRPNPPWDLRSIEGVPGLMVIGEYEWMAGRVVPAAVLRAQQPGAPVAVLCDAGRGHFDFSDELVRYLALFLRKAVAARLPAGDDGGRADPGATPGLRPVDPREGWLVSSGSPEAPRAPAAPAGAYSGDRREAFWAFDEEMARATEAHEAVSRGKAPQLLGFRQGGEVIDQRPGTAMQVALVLPPLDDSLSFHLEGMFLDTVPPGNPEKWSGLPAGAPIGHASGGGPVTLMRICGPVEQVAPGTFALRFYRMGLDSPRRSGDVWLVASHPGDEVTKGAVQQANLRIPVRHPDGAPQVITFPAISDQPAGIASLRLGATSSAGAPVHYFVREGPAEVEGDKLVFTPVPPRATFPVRVTVVAWQWGRSTPPQLQGAEPVERTFRLTK